MKFLSSKIAFGILAGWLTLAVLVTGVVAQQSPTTKAPLTDRERVHSRYLVGNRSEPPVPADKTIPGMLSQTSGDLVIDRPDDLASEVRPYPPPPPYPPYALVLMACGHNVAVLATALSGTSHMTENQTFLFTDWSFEVNEVLKNNPKAPVKTHEIITVIKLGGQLMIDGRTITAIEDNFKEFTIGQKYLLYLDFIPETGAYKATAEPSFHLPGDKFEYLTKAPHHVELQQYSSNELVQAARAAKALTEGHKDCVGGETP